MEAVVTLPDAYRIYLVYNEYPNSIVPILVYNNLSTRCRECENGMEWYLLKCHAYAAFKLVRKGSTYISPYIHSATSSLNSRNVNLMSDTTAI
jgi:hypothetical protein